MTLQRGCRGTAPGGCPDHRLRYELEHVATAIMNEDAAAGPTHRNGHTSIDDDVGRGDVGSG